jgi:hypothetical protein
LITLGFTFLHLPYGQTEGIIKATGKNEYTNHPNSYGQICTRLSTVDIDSSSSSGRIEDDDDGDNIVIAIDSTGINVEKRPISKR